MMRASTRTLVSPALAAIVFVAGCATARAPSAGADMTPQVLVDQNGKVYRTTDSPAAASFDTPPDSTFRAVVAAYTALGIEPSSADPSQRTVSRQHLLLRSRFQGKPLSTAFDCGNGQFGPRADEGRIVADITSHVAATGSGSTLATTILATLTPNDGASRDPIRCVSNGGIEEKLRQEVSTRLGVPYERS
jgi:hypothetical protein